MANIVDYLRWRGDVKVSERPFNDVDNLVLSALSYIDFQGVVPAPGKGSISLGDACRKVLDAHRSEFSDCVKSLAKVTEEFLEVLAESPRFCDMALHDYVDVLDEEKLVQFAALQVDVSLLELYVAFRGTDDSLVGWREDFMLTFTIPGAHHRAARYLEDALRARRWLPVSVYVGGHSKGGNLALYAAMTCPEKLARKVMRVWSNDGPGLAPEVIEESPAEKLGERYRRIVPANDMVGIIFEREDDPSIVVKSSASGPSGHDLFTWEVDAFGVIEDERGLTLESQRIREGLKNWVERMPIDQRVNFVSEFFEALAAGGARNVSEVFENRQAMVSVINAMGDMTEETKQMLLSLTSLVITNRAAAATSAAQDWAGMALRRARGVLLDLRPQQGHGKAPASKDDSGSLLEESLDTVE